MINSTYDASGDDSKTDEVTVGPPDDTQRLQMKRRVGLLSGVALIVGNMIGTGVFVTPGGVLERSGSVGLAMIMWTACGLLSVLGSLAYAELGTLIPKSGGEHAYFLDGFGPLHKFWGPLPAFLFSWINVILLRPLIYAIGCLSVAIYTVVPIMSGLEVCETDLSQETAIQLIAVVCVLLIAAMNCFSVNLAINVQNVFTVAKLGAILVIIGCGIYQIITGNTQYLESGFEGSVTNFGAIATAFYGGLYSYDGWNNLNFLTEELKNPYVNLPRAIMIGIPLVTASYVFLNVAYLTVLSFDEIIQSEAVAVEFANYMLGPVSFILPVAIVMSAFGSVLSSALATSRLCYVSAREGHMIEVLSYIDVEKRTPRPALIFTTVLALILIFAGEITTLIDFFSFTIWIFYVLAMIVLLLLRKTRPDAPRPYKVWLIVPIIVIIVGSYLVVAPLVTDPAIEYAYIGAAILLGFIFYIPFVYKKYSMPFLGSMTRYIQLILNVAPTKMSLD